MTDADTTDAAVGLASGARSSRALGAGLFVVAVIAAYVWPNSPAGGVTICPFRRLSGLSCFGCGMTRAWTSLLHGDFVAALQFHPFAPVLFVGLGVWAAISAVEALRGRTVEWRRLPGWKRIEKPALVGALVFVVVFGLIRASLEFLGVVQPV
jgi:hypothetical protein